VAKKRITGNELLRETTPAAGQQKSDKIRSTSTRSKKPSPRKRSVRQKVRPSSETAVEFDPTDEQIRTRAYFISERRRRFDLPGDANSDWLEAKRQLLSETRH